MLIVKATIGTNGQILTVKGRDAWALLQLQAANENGCTPLDHPGPRWSGYVYNLRKAGFPIETVRESHGGHSPVDTLATSFAARSPFSKRKGANPNGDCCQ
jgi:hypothetical protein